MSPALRAVAGYLLSLGLATLLAVSPLSGAVGPPSGTTPAPGSDLPPVPGSEWAVAHASNAAHGGAATFIYAEGVTPWAVLVINAGDPHGVAAVNVSYDANTKTLTVTAQDSNSTNHVTILVNKAFVDRFISAAQGVLDVRMTNGVRDEGEAASHPGAGGSDVYVFQVDHFSTQVITMSSRLLTYVAIGGAAGLVVVAAVVVALRRRR